MAVLSVQILMVGNPTPSTGRLIFRLTTRGFGAQHVDTVAEAKSLLETFRYSVVLATEKLPDGRGYDLASLVARVSGYLFVGVPLSETLWLPVVARGSIVLGQRALNASVFENEVEIALGEARTEIKPRGSDAEPRAGMSRRVAMPRRRHTEAA
ncbi:MAG: hypothetical protein WBQ34_07855 [Candidatus Acidiferrales bacterium]